MSKIFEIYGSDAHAMTMSLMEAANVADMIPKGGSVALKPNLVVAGRPEEGGTTHAGVLSGCMEYLQNHGFTNISVIEGSWVGDDTGRAFRVAGYDKVCKQYGVPYYDLKRDKTRTVKTAMRPMEICCRALDTDFLINLPVLKGHCQTVMTCALKNCKGCLPDKEKRRFHSEGLHKPIAALGAYLKPQLTIVDSICGDLNFEEGGTPVYTNRMYLGTDPVQLDAYGCKLMGLSPLGHGGKPHQKRAPEIRLQRLLRQSGPGPVQCQARRHSGGPAHLYRPGVQGAEPGWHRDRRLLRRRRLPGEGLPPHGGGHSGGAEGTAVRRLP